jgi:hypothetical protein
MLSKIDPAVEARASFETLEVPSRGEDDKSRRCQL